MDNVSKCTEKKKNQRTMEAQWALNFKEKKGQFFDF